jgi:hypothetical protein
LKSLSALPGAPDLERVRGEILARAKASPIVFLQAPSNVHVSAESQRLREQLRRAVAPWEAFDTLLKKYAKDPKRLREVLLLDGYLYADTPALAVLISSGVSLDHIVDTKEAWITRGHETWRVVRKGKELIWAEGPETDAPAKLWLFDRVRMPGEPVTDDLHFTLDEARAHLGARTLRIERMTTEGLLASAEYGDVFVETVLRREGSRTHFECEVIPPDIAAVVQRERETERRRRHLREALRRAVDAQVAEALPFDEPKTEEGQQDGKLRGEWRNAYLNGASTFTFNGDTYSVFDWKGRPRTPQVCADFITDTWERMADTVWLPKDRERKRVLGRLDFSRLEVENRRSVESLLTFAGQNPNWFELLIIPEPDRVAFHNRRTFFERLGAMYRDFAPLDVVAILGLRDDEKLHYHSFFIVADDPVTGMPVWVAANAGRPRIRTWEGEMQNAPRRSLYARIRPTLSWLESIALEPAIARADAQTTTPPLNAIPVPQ